MQESKNTSEVADDPFRNYSAEFHSRLVFYFTHRRLRDPEDLAQEVMVRARNHYVKGTPIREFERFCYGIAKNVALEAWKRRREDQFSEKFEETDGAATKDVESAVNRTLLEQCLRLLPVEDREILVQYHSGDRDELRSRLGVSENALRIRVHRILESVRHAVDEQDRVRRPNKTK